MVECPSTAAKSAVRCPRVGAERSPAEYRCRRPEFVANEPWPTMLRPGFPRLSHPGLAHAIPSIAFITQVYWGETPGFAHDLGAEGDRSTATGASTAERLTTSEEFDWASSISPDGERVVFTKSFGGPATSHTEIWEVPLDGDRTQVPLLQGEFRRGNAEHSPNGDWLLYRSEESGESEIYAQPYPGPGSVETISIGGGNRVIMDAERLGDHLPPRGPSNGCRG